jgi:DNA mismatch endonuclease (patch repair protein)
MMAGIRGKNTKPEIVVRKMLFANGYRFRINKKIGNARPDIVLPKWNLCIFIHGCFWHRHQGCKLATTPKTNVEFWANKFQGNIARDQQNYTSLIDANWRIGIIWECKIRSADLFVEKLYNFVESSHGWEI